MTAKEQLLEELAQVPDFLAQEVLDFLLFIKIKLRQRVSEAQSSEDLQAISSQSFLEFVNEMNSQVPSEEWAKLPSDLAQNIDHYLYGAPKPEE
ncbi:MAG: hypothetical protein HC895_02630 [Leptolyngbyaceae cyanobacterium SM1_3_5]|nr:hypothetical protein [Leptolyngbyaceae cyanobacterium SM1_3_5]